MNFEADSAHAHGVDHSQKDCYTVGIGQGDPAELERVMKSFKRQYNAMRRCLSCGVLAECDAARPCAACGASHFHLIPPARELAEW